MRMKLNVMIISLCVCLQSVASINLYEPSKPRTFTSYDGSVILRTSKIEGLELNHDIWKQTNCIIYKYNAKIPSYEKVKQLTIQGDPDHILINDGGSRIVALGQRGNDDKSNTVMIYDTEGVLLKNWTLEDIYRIKATYEGNPERKLTKFNFVGGWRGEASWSSNEVIKVPFADKDGEVKFTLERDLLSNWYEIDVKKLEVRIGALDESSKKLLMKYRR